MTNIATKNGAIIVKDGSVAESCNCCGDWYCYAPGCGDCPCGYSGTMPSQLSLSLSFDIDQPLYGAAIGNFTNAAVSTTKLSPAQAAAINGTYSMARMTTNSCLYEYRVAGAQGFDTIVRVHVGYGGRLGYSYQPTMPYQSTGYAPCPADHLSVSLIIFQFSLAASLREDGYAGPLNSVCGGASYLSNASTHQHNGATVLAAPSDSSSDWSCLGAPIYNLGFGFDWSESASEVPSCSHCIIDSIDHQWKVGVKYTDTSGANPAVTTYPKAVTLRVFTP